MNGNAKHLVFVTIVSEGFDYPPIDTVVFMRPTRSPVLYVQTVGRGLRPSEGKENCLVLDYAEVVKNCGTISNPILTEKGSTKKNKELYDFKVCAKCFEIIQKYPCKACGFEPPKKESKINLKNIPDSESSIIGQSKFIFEVRDVSFSRHISKNKNECLKVTYLAQNFFDGLIEEFFMMGAPWAEKKCSQRMLELGVVFTSDLEYLAKRKPTRIPKKLEYEIDGKFKKVKRLVFV
jgi:DNA repair protein RadD